MLRQQIMQAAREMFVAEGVERVSMRKIAEKISYSPTTIYLYFKDKNDLLAQICEETFARLTHNIVGIQRLSDNPIEKLRLGLREYIQFGLKHPEQYTMTFIVPLPVGAELPFEQSNGSLAFGTLRAVVKECADANLLKDNDIEVISQMLWAAIHGLTSLLIQHGGFPFADRETLIDNLIATLIAGLRK